MSNFSAQQENKEEGKTKTRVRREKLAGYFYDMSKLVFAALILGGISPLFSDSSNDINWAVVAVGAFGTYYLASIANVILKK